MRRLPVLLTLLAAGCGSSPPVAADDYCDLSAQIVSLPVTSVSVHSGTSGEQVQGQLEQAQQQLAEARTALGRWRDAAPEPLRADVAVVAAERLRLLDVVEGRAPLEASLAQSDTAAYERVRAATAQQCGIDLPALTPAAAPDREPPPAPPPPPRRPGPPPPPPPRG